MTYGGQGCKKRGVNPSKHGIIYEKGTSKPNLILAGEPPLGFAAVQMRVTQDGERLSRASRIDYSKAESIVHDCKVFFIGRIVAIDFHIVSDAVDACRTLREPLRARILRNHEHRGREDEPTEPSAFVARGTPRARHDLASRSSTPRNRSKSVDGLSSHESGSNNNYDNGLRRSVHEGSPFIRVLIPFRNRFSEAGLPDDQPVWRQQASRQPLPAANPSQESTRTGQRPASRNDFKIAIFCALSAEVSAIENVFDDRWDNEMYGKTQGDYNTYHTGRIGRHNVVVAPFIWMDMAATRQATAHLYKSWPNLKLVLIVGVCSAVPFPVGPEGEKEGEKEIILGDVVISFDVSYRLRNRFIYQHTLYGSLGIHNKEITAFLARLKTISVKENLRVKIAEHLLSLQRHDPANAVYPGARYDNLFDAGYYHREDFKTCDGAMCDGPRVHRNRFAGQIAWPHPDVHFGTVASGHRVVNSGLERDRIAKEQGAIAFDVGDAGVHEVPYLRIKGVRDYADGHHSHGWMHYAAATAAACAKAFLQLWPSEDEE